MSATDRQRDISELVEREHEHLRRALEDLQAAVSNPESGEGFAQWRLERIWQLRDFKNDLLKHFDLEEEGGFMRDVRRRVPNSDEEVKGLLKEHRQMEDSLDAFVSMLKDMTEPDPEKLGRLQRRVGEFAETIQKHESTEQHLLQRSYYRDYGGPE